MNDRALHARQIMKMKRHASQTIGTGDFTVRSQTDPDRSYVSRTGGGLVCACPDHKKNGSDCKHIKVVLELIKRNVFGSDGFRIMDRSGLKLCKFCDSGNIVKKGLRRNKTSTMQVFRCKDCKRRFTANFGFERKQHDDRTITGALQMYYAGMSVRDISDYYEMMGVDVSFKTVYNWIDEYSRLAATYLNGIVPRVGGWFRADEVWIKIGGRQCSQHVTKAVLKKQHFF